MPIIRFAAALSASMLSVISSGWADSDAVLTITVQNVSSHGGDLRIALYDRAHWDTDHGDTVKDTVVPAVAPSTIIEFRDLKPGTYGLKMYQGFQSQPEIRFHQSEPTRTIRFSNDAPAIFGAPAFDRAKFTVQPGANAMTVHLR